MVFSWSAVAAIASGAVIGALSRYGLSLWVGRVAGATTLFPWGIFTVNVLGCLLMGLATAFLTIKGQVGTEWRLFLTVGVLGSFTTFSAFSFDVAVLIEKGYWQQAMLYMLATCVLCLVAFFAGLAGGKSIFY